MRFFSLFLISILLLQALAEVSMHSHAADDQLAITQADERRELLALHHKKHHPRIRKMINCSHACSRRCKKSSRKKVCHRACKSCCKTCNCVPPGTYGNKEVCPCYASLRTHGNKLKCP